MAEQIIGLLRQAEVGLVIPHELLADPASLTRPLLLTSNSRPSLERLSVALAKRGCQPVGEPDVQTSSSELRRRAAGIDALFVRRARSSSGRRAD